MGEGRVPPRMKDKLRAQCEDVEVRFLVQGDVGDALKPLIFNNNMNQIISCGAKCIMQRSNLRSLNWSLVLSSDPRQILRLFFVIFTLYALFLDIDCILAFYN